MLWGRSSDGPEMVRDVAEATIRSLVTSEQNNGGAGQGTEGKLDVKAHGGPSFHTVGEEVNRF